MPSAHMKRRHESKGHKKSLTCLILYNLMHMSENLPFICIAGQGYYVGHHNYPILLQYTSWITNNEIFNMQNFTKWLIPIHQLVIVKNQPRANTGQHLKPRFDTQKPFSTIVWARAPRNNVKFLDLKVFFGGETSPWGLEIKLCQK